MTRCGPSYKLVKFLRIENKKELGISDEERESRNKDFQETFQLLYGTLILNLLCSGFSILYYMEVAALNLYNSISQVPFLSASQYLAFYTWLFNLSHLLNAIRLPMADINGTCAIACHVIFSPQFRHEFAVLFRCRKAVDPVEERRRAVLEEAAANRRARAKQKEEDERFEEENQSHHSNEEGMVAGTSSRVRVAETGSGDGLRQQEREKQQRQQLQYDEDPFVVVHSSMVEEVAGQEGSHGDEDQRKECEERRAKPSKARPETSTGQWAQPSRRRIERKRPTDEIEVIEVDG